MVGTTNEEAVGGKDGERRIEREMRIFCVEGDGPDPETILINAEICEKMT